MISREWFLKEYPEWVNNNDEDVRKTLQAAREAIKPALFCLDGRRTRCLRVRMKEFLRAYGVDVDSYDRDYYRTKAFHSDEFLMELGLIHMARHLIKKQKQELYVLRKWEGYDYVRVYADGGDDARTKAKAYPAPAHCLKSIHEVIDEVARENSSATICV